MIKVIKYTIASLFLATLLGCAQQSTEELQAAAEVAFKDGNYEAAVVNYKASIQQMPNDAAMRLSLARLYLDIGQYQNAEKEFTKAKELGAQKKDLDHHIARLLWHLGQVDQLLEFEREEVPENNAAVTFYAFLANITLNNIEQAEAMAALLAETVAGSEFTLLAEAYLAFVNEDIEQAQALSSKALAIAPRLMPALKLKVLMAINADDFDAGHKYIQQYSTLAPNDLREQLFFAGTYIQFNRMDEAKRVLKPLDKVLKGNAALDQLYGHVYYIEQDYIQSQQYIERAIQNGARTTKNLIIAGYVNYALQNFERAYDYLMSAKDDLTDDDPAMKILAISQMKLGKTMEAAELLRKSAVGGSREIPAYVAASQRLLANGQFELAEELVTQLKGTPDPTPFDIVQIGLAKFSVKDPSGVDDIKSIIENNPDLIEAQMALVSIYLKSGKPDELIQIARGWQTKPDAADALKIRGYNLEGLIQERLENNEAAQQAYQGALALDKSNIHSHVFLAKLNIEKENYAEASSHIDMALAANPVSYDALLLSYNNQVAQKQHQAGLDLLANTYKKHPDNIQVAELYAIGLHFQGQYKALLKLAGDRESISENMYQVIADAHLKLDDRKAAIDVYKDWERQAPRNSVPFYHYIYLFESEARFDEALKAIENKRRTFKDEIGLKALHAQFLLYTQRVKDAKALIAEIKKQDPNAVTLENLEAQVPLFERQFVQAIPGLLKTYDTEPTDRKGYNIVLAYLGADQHDNILPFADKHLAGFPKSMHVRNVASNLLLEKGDYAKALAGFELLLAEIPDSPAMLNNIAWLNYKLGKLDDAWLAAQKALDLVPNNYNVMDTAASILAAQGKLSDAKALAKTAYLQVVEQNPANRTEVTLNYITILEQAGDNEEAAKIRRTYGM